MDWGSVIGAGIGAIASHINQAWSQHFSSKEARSADKRAYANWRRSYQYQNLEGPSLMRQGLEKAGFNPILAVNGGMSMPSGQSFSSNVGELPIADSVGSARQGAKLASEMMAMFKEEQEQAKTKTKADKKSLDIIDAQKEKIEAETDVLKSQEVRNWVGSAGGFIDDGANALLLWNLLNDRRKRGSVYSRNGARSVGASSSGVGSGLSWLAPLLFGGAKVGAAGVGGYGLYQGIKAFDSAVEKSPNGKKVRDGKYYLHGNWSR